MAGNANAPWMDVSFVLESVASVQGMASSVMRINVVNQTATNKLKLKDVVFGTEVAGTARLMAATRMLDVEASAAATTADWQVQQQKLNHATTSRKCQRR
ncbi:unnamed protein product [Aphanomyces euteiches]